MSPDLRWEIPQTMDTVDPASAHYNPKSAYAKTLLRDGKSWGPTLATNDERHRKFAHDDSAMDCQICHTSWATSYFGCHLPMKANQRVPQNKFEGVTDRNYTSYNPQVVRDDVFMLGIDGTVKKNRMGAFIQRRGSKLSKRKPRMGLFAGADSLCRRLQRSGIQSALSAYDERRRHNEKLHRLSPLEGQRQQCLDDAVVRFRHGHGEHLRSLSLCRRGT